MPSCTVIKRRKQGFLAQSALLQAVRGKIQNADQLMLNQSILYKIRLFPLGKQLLQLCRIEAVRIDHSILFEQFFQFRQPLFQSGMEGCNRQRLGKRLTAGASVFDRAAEGQVLKFECAQIFQIPEEQEIEQFTAILDPRRELYPAAAGISGVQGLPFRPA